MRERKRKRGKRYPAKVVVEEGVENCEVEEEEEEEEEEEGREVEEG